MWGILIKRGSVMPSPCTNSRKMHFSRQENVADSLSAKNPVLAMYMKLNAQNDIRTPQKLQRKMEQELYPMAGCNPD
jgi:hypothetical protein